MKFYTTNSEIVYRRVSVIKDITITHHHVHKLDKFMVVCILLL